MPGELEAARGELEATREELEAARGELDRLKARSSQLEQEQARAAHARTELRSALGRIRAAASARMAQLQRQLRRPRPAEARLQEPAATHSTWVGRGFALTVLAAAIVALLIVLQSP